MLRSPVPVVDVINPKVPASEIFAPGLEKLGWFSAFKNSPRNCRRMRSVIAKERNRLMSRLTKPGPRSVLRPTLPNFAPFSAAKAVVSK